MAGKNLVSLCNLELHLCLRDSKENSILHTGARVNVVLCTYLLTYLYNAAGNEEHEDAERPMQVMFNDSDDSLLTQGMICLRFNSSNHSTNPFIPCTPWFSSGTNALTSNINAKVARIKSISYFNFV